MAPLKTTILSSSGVVVKTLPGKYSFGPLPMFPKELRNFPVISNRIIRPSELLLKYICSSAIWIFPMSPITSCLSFERTTYLILSAISLSLISAGLLNPSFISITCGYGFTASISVFRAVFLFVQRNAGKMMKNTTIMSLRNLNDLAVYIILIVWITISS